MRRTTGAMIVGVWLAVLPEHAAGQAQVPDTGMSAAGADVGLLFTADDRQQTALAVDGLYDYYLTPRVGIRGAIGWSDPELERTGGSLRQIRLTAGVHYNWEGGVWHPFVGAGAGVYFVREKIPDASDPDGEAKGGFHLNGGFEYFARRDVTIKGELRYQAVADHRGLDPSGLVVAIGLKRYF